MGKLEFGVCDGFAAHEMALSPVAADVYEQHLREAQLAEELGYQYYFTCSAPTTGSGPCQWSSR